MEVQIRASAVAPKSTFLPGDVVVPTVTNRKMFIKMILLASYIHYTSRLFALTCFHLLYTPGDIHETSIIQYMLAHHLPQWKYSQQHLQSLCQGQIKSGRTQVTMGAVISCVGFSLPTFHVWFTSPLACAMRNWPCESPIHTLTSKTGPICHCSYRRLHHDHRKRHRQHPDHHCQWCRGHF